MARRKWCVRGLVFLVVAACGCAAYWYQRYTNPTAVRQMVLARFRTLFPGAEVSVESARLRILGGITVRDIRLARKDDPDRVEFLRIPSALLYHDKEKMLDGAMALRKIELQRPKFRLERNPNGTWNVQGLAAAARLDQTIPTVVVEQGTISFQDRATSGSGLALELTDVNLTLINDPIDLIQIEGAAISSIVGKVQLSGQLQRSSNEITLSIRAENVPLNTGWADRIDCDTFSDKLEGLVLEGKAAIKADLSFRPRQAPAFSYDVRLDISEARLQHPKIPLPLENMEATLLASAGELRLEKFRAHSGPARIEARMRARLPCPDQSWDGFLEIKNLRLNDALFAGMPEKIQNLQRLFQVKGVAGIRLDACFKEGMWTTLTDETPSAVSLIAEDLSCRFQKFDYPLEKINGVVKMDLTTQKTEVDVTAQASGQPAFIKGWWKGVRETACCQFDITGAGIPIDNTLLSALPEAQEKRMRSFNPSGKIDVKYHLRKDPGGEYAHEYHVRVFDAKMRWDLYPYALENVSGLIDGYRDHWEFRDFQATHQNGGKLFLHGNTSPRKDGTTALWVELSGKQVAMDEELKTALAAMPGLGKTWDSLRPRGRADFHATIDRTSPRFEDMEVRLTMQGCTMVPTFLPYTFEQCAGKVRYFRNRVEIERFYARRRDTEFSITDGTFDIHPTGYYADLSDIRFRKLSLDDEFVSALPNAMQSMVKSLSVDGALAGKTRLVVSQGVETGNLPDLFWDGQIWFTNLTFSPALEVSQAQGTLACRGRYNGRQLLGVNGNLILNSATMLKQPFKGVHLGLLVEEDHPQVLSMQLKAPVHGGDITGQIRLEFGSTLRYDLNLTANQINLEDLGRQLLGSKSQISGLAVGRLVLSGQGTNLNTLQGSGTIDVPTGRLLNLPLLLDLLKFLGLHWPDRTAFEEVHAQFAINGRRVHVGRLELLGSAVSLYGQGDFNLDGTNLELDFYPSWARVEQVLPPAIRSVPSSITRNLLIIEMRGKVGSEPGDLKFHKKPLPLLFDPLLQIRDRVTGQPVLTAPTGRSGVMPFFSKKE